MKKNLQAFLQRILGFERYLYLFSRFKIMTLHWDRQDKEGDFNHFLTLLQPHFHVLDIGANVGIMAVLMARRCPQGRVYAFEPVPDNYRALQQVVGAYRLDNVSTFPLALGDRRGTVAMAMPILQGVRMQGLSHVEHQAIEGYPTQQVGYQVEQVPLDELEALRGGQVHAIKIDVENYEQFVLQGGRQLLQRCQPILYCELWDNDNRRRCFELLTGLGYCIQVLVQGQLREFDPHTHTHHNFFFTPAK